MLLHLLWSFCAGFISSEISVDIIWVNLKSQLDSVGRQSNPGTFGALLSPGFFWMLPFWNVAPCKRWDSDHRVLMLTWQRCVCVCVSPDSPWVHTFVTLRSDWKLFSPTKWQQLCSWLCWFLILCGFYNNCVNKHWNSMLTDGFKKPAGPALVWLSGCTCAKFLLAAKIIYDKRCQH